VAGALLAGALAVGGTVVSPAPAEAAPLISAWICNGAGNMFANTSPTSTDVELTFQGVARCNGGDRRGPYIAQFRGEGELNAVGGCDAGLPLLATGFRMNVTMTAVSVTFPSHVRTERLRWAMPITLYPNLTPALVLQKADGSGPGGAIRGVVNIISSGGACSGTQRSSGVLFDTVWIENLLGILN
jgi:hypothetical protein